MLYETDLYAPLIYGAFMWSLQISRMIMLLLAPLLSAIVVTRTQELPAALDEGCADRPEQSGLPAIVSAPRSGSSTGV